MQGTGKNRDRLIFRNCVVGIFATGKLREFMDCRGQELSNGGFGLKIGQFLGKLHKILWYKMWRKYLTTNWASSSSIPRVGPDSPFALLSPVLGSEIPFEKGFLENPFSPSRNTIFCPVLGLHGPFAEPSTSFMHVFRKIIVPNLIGNYYLVNLRRYAPVFPSTYLVVQLYNLLASILKRDLVRYR